jgi:two-component system phosphate regulon sensor histidine kinase PhoR
VRKKTRFRKKIITWQIILFVIFVAALFPLIDRTVHRIVRDTLEENTAGLIDAIDDAFSEKEMIELLKQQEFFSFYRMSILNDQGELIYDSHLSRLLGPNFESFTPTKHPEVEEALKEGIGYSISFSNLFKGRFAYVAERFSFQGKTYVLRTAFPFAQLQELIHNFELGFLLFSFAVLLFFNALIWFIFSRFTRPISSIIEAVAPYQRGEMDEIPEIRLPAKSAPNDEFTRLAQTLNSLSGRIKEQIMSITSERNEKEAILQSLGEGVIAVDGDMRIRYINSIGSKMLGMPRRELLGAPFPTVEGKAGHPLIERACQLLQACSEQETTLTDSLALGVEKKIYIDLIAVPKGKGSGAIIVLQDKSSHYKVLEMGKDFVANASHELRTPITIIKGFAETLQDMPEMSRDMLDEITEKIVRNCERMDNLVKNLLTLADIENIPESRFKDCDLVTLAENCRHMLRSVYTDAQVEIEKTEEEMTISADGDILELAVINLLDNAAKYSKGPAHITIRLASVEDDEVKIEISDKGMGIPPEDLEHIFGRFYTVDKTHSRRLGGAGLGLSIVKNIIDKHDGLISATSKLGEGTTFTIILPKVRHSRS